MSKFPKTQKVKPMKSMPLKLKDVDRIKTYFELHEMWEEYLAFVLSGELSVSLPEILSVNWNMIFGGNGRIRESWFQKEDCATLTENCKEAIEFYIDKTDVRPMNIWSKRVFSEGFTPEKYRESLNRAVTVLQIGYNVGVKSYYKTNCVLNAVKFLSCVCGNDFNISSIADLSNFQAYDNTDAGRKLLKVICNAN